MKYLMGHTMGISCQTNDTVIPMCWATATKVTDIMLQ